MCLHAPILRELPCTLSNRPGWSWGTAVTAFANVPLKQGVSLTAASRAFWQCVKQVFEQLSKVLLVGAVTAVVRGIFIAFFGVAPGEVT